MVVLDTQEDWRFAKNVSCRPSLSHLNLDLGLMLWGSPASHMSLGPGMCASMLVHHSQLLMVSRIQSFFR